MNFNHNWIKLLYNISGKKNPKKHRNTTKHFTDNNITPPGTTTLGAHEL